MSPQICAKLYRLGKAAPLAASYNRVVRMSAVFPLILSLAACNRGMQNNEAVRQGVIDRMAQKGVAGVDVALTSVKLNGTEADAVAAISPKRGSPPNASSVNYH